MKRYVDALVREALNDAIEAGLLRTCTVPGFRVAAPRYPAFGDLACDVALVLARELGEPPRALAALVMGRLRDRHGWLAGVEVGGPGFVNFRFAPPFWRSRLAEAAAAGAAYGRTGPAPGRRVRIEVERDDATAAPSVADGRAGAIAGATARLLAAAGCDVEQVGAVPEVDGPAVGARPCGARAPAELIAIAGASQAGEVARRDRVGSVLRLLSVHSVRLARDGEPVRGDVPLADVVREIGRDATRFLLLLERPDRPVELDLELAKLECTDNPVFYVQYACARLDAVLRAAPAVAEPPDLSQLDDLDVEPLRALAAWPEVVDEASRALEPHRVAAHAVELAAVVHRWMNRTRVGTEADTAASPARLALATCVRQVLHGALSVCGVSVPEPIVRPDVEEVA
jgi:arginyl-tRNA synthetase